MQNNFRIALEVPTGEETWGKLSCRALDECIITDSPLLVSPQSRQGFLE